MSSVKPSSRRDLRTLAAVASLGGVLSCSDPASGPADDCDWLIGRHFIDLLPEPLGTFLDYEIDVGDSIQVAASVQRIDAAQRTFNAQQGWYCITAASSPVTATVSFSTNDTQLVRLRPGGWIHGLQAGQATVKASSAAPPVTTDISVLVYAP